MDTAGVQITVASYLFGARPKHLTNDLAFNIKINSQRDFRFPLIRSSLVDRSNNFVPPLTYPAPTVYPWDLTDDHIFELNQTHEVSVYFKALPEFPAHFQLPPLFFEASSDSLKIPVIIIEDTFDK